MSLVVFLGTAHADDTDIYLVADLPDGSEPLVMFTLDWRPNLGATVCNSGECQGLIDEGYLVPDDPSQITFFEMMRAVLEKVFDPLTGIKVGLMMNHDAQNCSGPELISNGGECSNGGYVVSGFQLFEAGDSNNAKLDFKNQLAAIPLPQGNASHSHQGKELFFEFFRYLTGQGVYNGHNGFQSFDGSVQGGGDRFMNVDVEFPDLGWDVGIESAGDYISPIASASECTDIYSVNMMFQVSSTDDQSNNAVDSSIADGGFGTGWYAGGGNHAFPDVVQYLYDSDLADGNYGTVPDLSGVQNVTSYFLIDPSKINNVTTAYAAAGGTDTPIPLSDNPDDLYAALRDLFDQILSVSTTFVSAAVPVNVFNRAEVIDNAYLALFKVDPDGRPDWPGNLKKLKLDGLGTDTITVVDTSGNDAIDSDGRIKNSALTYWTSAADLPVADTSVGEVAGKDGRFVERGGAGQRIPGYISGSPEATNGAGGRTVYYDVTAGSLAAFNSTAATGSALQSDLGAASSGDAQDLIEYARGLDVDDEDGDGNTTEARSWIMGDPLHSKPLPVNYGTLGGYSTTNPAIFIAMGAGDGMLHFIRNTSTGGSESGQELWAFMPREVMGNVETLRTNAAGASHPYGVDGAPVTYIKDVDNDGNIESGDGDKVYLYFGLRRGGRAYYGIDVTNPASPDLMWRLDTSNSDFSELGYTFSQPQTGLVATSGGAVPAVIFAGGYDLNKDDRSGIGTDDSYGNAIYVVNAETGALIWKAVGGNSVSSSTVFQHASLVDSIPANVKAVDTDGDQLLDRIVVGDTGGNVWRADISGSDTSAWKLTHLAAVGRHAVGSSTVADDRRFFHGVNIAQTRDATGDYDAVLLGSGDRPDPLDKGGVANDYFYMIKDRNTGAGAGTNIVIDQADFGDVTDNCLQTNPACGTVLTDGWKLRMVDTGEKVLASPLTVGGVVFFTSYLPNGGPPSAACQAVEGGGYLYAVKLQDATGVFNFDTSNDITNDSDDDVNADRGKDLLSPGIPPEVLFLPEDIIMTPDFETVELELKTRARTFWQAGEDSDL
jgi:type IV pilus assembly protein PilY1